MVILVEHKKRYLGRRKVEIEELLNALDSNSFDMAIMIGHRLKGSGETFGYPVISELGTLLEAAAHAHDRERVDEIIEKLELIVEEESNAISNH
jgi:HPt (histidine-containing phosphotransfer) domain-containing protein